MRTKSVQRQPDIPWFKRLTSWFGQWPLFVSITVWVLLALATFTLLGLIWSPENQPFLDRLLTNWKGRNVKDPLDLIRIALTTIGGIGAVGYLVIKYRERSSAEHGLVDQLILRAVEQLGSSSPQVRIAGVYALTDIADTYKGNYKQRVVDILCGYLRTDRTEKDKKGNFLWTVAPRSSARYPMPVSLDNAVESTILSTMASHLRKHSSSDYLAKQHVADSQLWCSCSFDFHGSIFTETLNWKGVHLKREANFERAKFYGYIDLSHAEFDENIKFRDCLFNEEARFMGVRVKSTADFTGAKFIKSASFSMSEFRNCEFGTATFTQANFTNSKLMGAYFGGAKFQRADFSSSIFGYYVFFTHAEFASQPNFTGSIFNSASRGELQDSQFIGKIADNYLDPTLSLPIGASWAHLDRDGNVINDLPQS